jgi:hypothetical protein
MIDPGPAADLSAAGSTLCRGSADIATSRTSAPHAHYLALEAVRIAA